MVNIDAMTETELKEAIDTFRKLALYCYRARRARVARMAGKVAKATVLETHNEMTYSTLPDWAKW